MDEIAALTSWERDDLHRGILAALRGEPFDEYETKYWTIGWRFYWDSKPRRDEQQCILN